MALFGAAIGAVAGAAAGVVSTQLLTRKNANAYRSYAKDIRKAAEDYSGQNAYNAMQNAGMQEANIVNQRNLNAQASRAPSNMTNKAANAANLQGNYSQGYNLGAQNQKTALDAAYNAKTAKAQQALNQANIDYKAGTAATQAAMNAAGGLASLYGQVKGGQSPNSQTTSDERVKEYDNHSGLPKADVDDALRRIESINYKYKDGTGLDDKEHTGVTAQSVENTAFDGMVSENENGVKQLDKQMMLEAVLAGIASLRKELDELECSGNGKITSDENYKTAEDFDFEAAAKQLFGGQQLENEIENGNITPEQLPENSSIQKEAEQLTDNNPYNDEVKNEAVDEINDDFFKKFSEQLDANEAANDDGVDTGYGKAYNDRVELDDKAQKAAEDLGYGELNPEIKHGYYGDYGETMKFVDKLNKYKKEGINDKFKSPFDTMSLEDVKQAAKSRKNASKFNTTLKDARAERAYLTGKGSVLDTKPSVYWSKERFDEYNNELAKEISLYSSLDKVADNDQALSKLAQKAAYVKRVEKELKLSNAANGRDVNTYSEKPTNKQTETEEKKPSAGINWDNVKVYKPGENSPNLVSGYRYDKDGNLIDEYGREPKDYEHNEPIENEVENNDITETDEDFLGPDEYIDENGNIQVDPNWKPENADEDFVGPDEQLMLLGDRDLIPPDNYSHDFDYSIEELGRQPGTPEEAEFESKIVDVNDHGLLRAKPTDFGGSSVGSVSQAPLAQAERHTGGNAIGTKGILPAAALHYSPSSVHSSAAGTPKQFNGTGKVGNIGKPLDPLNSDASVIQGKQSESSGFVTNNGGNISSGGTNFRSSLGHVDPAQLPSEVEEHTAPEYESLLETENLKDALINRINMMLDEIDPRTLKQLGFSPVNHYYKGNPLTKLDGATLSMVSEMLEDYTE